MKTHFEHFYSTQKKIENFFFLTCKRSIAFFDQFVVALFKSSNSVGFSFPLPMSVTDGIDAGVAYIDWFTRTTEGANDS